MAPTHFRKMIPWYTFTGNVIQETASAGRGHGAARPLLGGGGAAAESQRPQTETTRTGQGHSLGTVLLSLSVCGPKLNSWVTSGCLASVRVQISHSWGRRSHGSSSSCICSSSWSNFGLDASVTLPDKSLRRSPSELASHTRTHTPSMAPASNSPSLLF